MPAPQDGRRIERRQFAGDPLPDRVGRLKRDHLLGNDAQQPGQSARGAPERRQAGHVDDLGEARLMADEPVDALGQIDFALENEPDVIS